MNSKIVITQNGDIWFENDAGQPHRDEDKPSVIRSDGTIMFYKNGDLHRGNNLPAVIYSDGGTEYFNHGLKIWGQS